MWDTAILRQSPGKRSAWSIPLGTDFEISNAGACDNGKRIFVTADVTNIGSCAGKEVVQLYYTPPAGKLPKPARELCAFAKTSLLAPGETETVTLSCDITDMASFDDTGMIEQSAWVME